MAAEQRERVRVFCYAMIPLTDSFVALMNFLIVIVNRIIHGNQFIDPSEQDSAYQNR